MLNNIVALIVGKEEFKVATEKIINNYQHRRLRFDPIQWVKDMVTRVIERIFEFFLKNANFDIKSSDAVSKISTVALVLSLIIAGIFVIVAFKAIKNKKRKISANTIFGEEITEETTYETLNNKAVQFEKQEKYREAVRISFVAILFKMHHEGLITLEECKTTREICDSLQNKGDNIGEIFSEVSKAFNSTWYGFRISSAKYKSWNELKNKMIEEVKEYEKKNA